MAHRDRQSRRGRSGKLNSGGQQHSDPDRKRIGSGAQHQASRLTDSLSWPQRQLSKSRRLSRIGTTSYVTSQRIDKFLSESRLSNFGRFQHWDSDLALWIRTRRAIMERATATDGRRNDSGSSIASGLASRLTFQTANMPRLSDDEWAELAQDLPSRDDPFLKKYLQGREALIADEHKQRSGACRGHANR
jgi:hypothetical protein